VVTGRVSAVIGQGRVRGLDAGFVTLWLERTATKIGEHRDYLTQLDAAIGDADHGINMDRGFGVVLAKLGDGASRAPGPILEASGNALILSVGGAAGPLYGSAFRGMGRSLGDRAVFDAEDLLVALRAALAEIQRIGAANEGDKTIVDALVPAIAGFERGLRAGESLPEAARRAREAAEEGMRATVPMHARKGRASYLGPRSVGHQDPGATSTELLFEALEQAADETDGAGGAP
jgi:dihydroxyacetone kinase-like protein